MPALVDGKRIVATDLPVGAGPRSKLRRYRITDPYLRFWFRYCAPHLADMARGRSDLAIGHFDRDFASWRGKAIEPVVHAAISRMARQDRRLGGLVRVGAWWDRAGKHECDIAGAQRSGDVALLGTVKWRARQAVSSAELAALADARSVLPRAAGAQLAVVCPAGVRGGVEPDVLLDADDVLSAFR